MTVEIFDTHFSTNQNFSSGYSNSDDFSRVGMQRRQGIHVSRGWRPNVDIWFVSCSCLGPSDVVTIRAAMDQWSAETCVVFKERTDEKNYIEIINGAGWVVFAFSLDDSSYVRSNRFQCTIRLTHLTLAIFPKNRTHDTGNELNQALWINQGTKIWQVFWEKGAIAM